MLSLVFIGTLALWGVAVAVPTVHHGRTVMTQMPDADLNLNVYTLPIGQGLGMAVQCPAPGGVVSIYDMGTMSEGLRNNWDETDVRNFFAGKYNLIRNIIISHNHLDHYSYINDVFGASAGLDNLVNIYMSCDQTSMAAELVEWVSAGNLEDKLVFFNGGLQCGPNGVDCGFMDLCPGHAEIEAHVLAANMGDCIGDNKNMDSLLVQVTHGDVTQLLSGDFEDATSSWSEDGPQSQVASHYGSSLVSTVYHVSHHGASSLANKPVFRDAVAPKSIIFSADPDYRDTWRHPRCAVPDAFVDYVQSLCKPLVGVTDPFYCGVHTHPSAPDDHKLQDTYTCGASEVNVWEIRTNNEFSIFTTKPLSDTQNLIQTSSNGNAWSVLSYRTNN